MLAECSLADMTSARSALLFTIILTLDAAAVANCWPLAGKFLCSFVEFLFISTAIHRGLWTISTYRIDDEDADDCNRLKWLSVAC